MMRRKQTVWRRIAGALLFVATLLCSTELLAEPRNTEAASRRFDAGVVLYKEGSLDAALVEFERAYELMPSYRLLYNMAQVQSERHDYVAAIELLERYLADGGQDVPAERRKEVLSELDLLRARVGFLIVEADADGAEVYLNNQHIGTLPIRRELAINPGKHFLRIEKPGFRVVEKWFKAASGDEVRLRLRMVPHIKDDPAVTAGADRTSHAPEADYVPFWIAAGTTGVLAVAAGTFGLLTLNAKGDLDRELENVPSDTAATENARDRGKTYALVADGAALGAAVAAGLAVYYLLDPPTDVEKAPAGAASSSPRVLPLLSGVAFTGGF